MPIALGIGFALLALLTGYWDGERVTLAFLLGLGVGVLVTRLVGHRATAARNPLPDKDSETIYAALEDIHWRLKRIEETQGLGPSPLEIARSAAATARELEARNAPLRPQSGGVATFPLTSPGVPVAAIAADANARDGTTLPDAITPSPKAPPIAPASERLPDTSAHDTLTTRLRQWLLGGNTVVRVGVVVLFFGVAFLLRFAIDRAVLPLELRVVGVGLGAIALLVVGWQLRTRRAAYGAALQGAGTGLLYLTLFAAFRLYDLIPATAALLTMIAVAGLSVLLALLQNAPGLMTIGVTGGFLAPILTATGGGHHVALFSYYLVLNAGILAAAWFRAWRGLNLLGFFFTAAIGLLWGSTSYSPALFSTTEPFLIAFFLLYLAVSVLFAARQGDATDSRQRSKAPPLHIIDVTLVFGLPIVTFGFQAGLMASRHSEFGLAYSALSLALVYVSLATGLHHWRRGLLTQLQESAAGLGVIFTTLAIPLALNARGTSAVWALEGAALVWVGIRQQRRHAGVFGLCLQGAAALAWFIQRGQWSDVTVALANPYFLGAALIAISGLFSAWQLQVRQRPSSPSALIVFGWGLGWWLLAGLGEAHQWLHGAVRLATDIGFLAGSALLADVLAGRLSWSHARLPAQGLVFALGWIFFLTTGQGLHAFSGGGIVAWPVAFAVLFALRRRQDDLAIDPDRSPALHALGYWLLAALGSHELDWLTGEFALAGGWHAAAVIVVPGLLLLLASSAWAGARWPLARAAPAYLGWGALPLLGTFALWSAIGDLTIDANPYPLPWLPLLNPVDLAHVFLGLVAWHWSGRVRSSAELCRMAPDQRVQLISLGTLAFIWLNAILLRSIHFWAGVAYTPGDLFASTLVQAALSLFWTTLSLIMMATGARQQRRALWMTGAALMAVVVIKLFMIDLDRVGSIARIVSFLGVGLLMLLIGYLAPVPPRVTDVDRKSPPEA